MKTKNGVEIVNANHPPQQSETAEKKYGDYFPSSEREALLEKVKKLEEWMPIDTAPKDGTLILAWDGKSIHTAYWGRSNPMNRQAWIGGHCKIDHIDQPTHWKHLPEAP